MLAEIIPTALTVGPYTAIKWEVRWRNISLPSNTVVYPYVIIGFLEGDTFTAAGFKHPDYGLSAYSAGGYLSAGPAQAPDSLIQQYMPSYALGTDQTYTFDALIVLSPRNIEMIYADYGSGSRPIGMRSSDAENILSDAFGYRVFEDILTITV